MTKSPRSSLIIKMPQVAENKYKTRKAKAIKPKACNRL
jgi:hypothetical protein